MTKTFKQLCMYCIAENVHYCLVYKVVLQRMHEQAVRVCV